MELRRQFIFICFSDNFRIRIFFLMCTSSPNTIPTSTLHHYIHYTFIHQPLPSLTVSCLWFNVPLYLPFKTRSKSLPRFPVLLYHKDSDVTKESILTTTGSIRPICVHGTVTPHPLTDVHLFLHIV